VSDQPHFITIDAYDIEPDPSVKAPVRLEIYLGRAYDVPFLAGVYGFKGGTEGASLSSLDLNEDKTTVFFCNDIDFSKGTPEVGGDDPVAFLFQDNRRLVFPFLSRQTFIGHNIPLLL
jgi:hypothetical protein